MGKIKTLKVMGEELAVKFSFATVMEYEARYGRVAEQETTTDRLRMIWCALHVANPEWSVSLEEMAAKMSAKEYSELFSAVMESMAEFYNIPMHAEDHVEEPAEEDGETAHP